MSLINVPQTVRSILTQGHSDDLNHLPYLTAVVEEALRLDSPYVIFARKATRACEVPLRYPVKGKDGQIMETVKVAKGTEVRIGEQLCSC